MFPSHDRGFQGKVFEDNKKKFTYTRNASRFARTQLIAGQTGFVPEGMIYDSINNQFVKDKAVLSGKAKKARLQKRFVKLGIKFDRRQRMLVPPPNMGRRVSGKVVAVLEKLDKNGVPYRWTAQYQTTVPFSKDGNWMQRLTDELQQRINLSDTKAEIVSLTADEKSLEFFPSQGQRGIALDSLRLKRVFLRIDELNDQHGWDTGQDKCVLDFLRYYYKEDHRLPSGLLDDDAFDFCFEEGYEREGVSTIELMNWCKMAQIKMIALDEDYKVIRLYKPHTPSKAKVLIYMIKNCHIHPITDPSKIKSISNIVASSDMVQGKTKRIREIITKQKEEESKLPITVITDEMRGKNSNLQYLCKMMIEKKIDVLGRKISWGKSGPAEFLMDGIKYVFHHKAQDVVKNYVEKVKKEEFRGQSASQYVFEAMDKFGIKRSTGSKLLNELFSTANTKHKILPFLLFLHSF